MKKDKYFFHGHSRLAEERVKLWETQQEAADFFGVSRVTWGQCERGNATPSGEVLAGLAQKGADVLYILTGIESDAHGRLATLQHAIEEAGKHVDSFEDTKRLGTALNAQMQAATQRVTPRERALLDNYRHTDESGKKIIEGTASFAAQSDKRKKA